jgi:hypothetical protein
MYNSYSLLYTSNIGVDEKGEIIKHYSLEACLLQNVWTWGEVSFD